MDAKRSLFWGITLCLATALESRVIVPRETDEEIPLSINPLEEDNNLGKKPAIWDPPTDDIEYSDYSGIIDPAPRPPKNDYDYKPGRDNKEDNRPGTDPVRFPVSTDSGKRPNEQPDKNDGIDKSDDEYVINPHDVGDIDKSGNNDKDFKPSLDEDKPVNEKDDDSEVGNTGPEESEEDNKDKEYKPENEGKPDEERKDDSVEGDNNKEHKPEDEEKLEEEESKYGSNDKEYKPEDEEKPGEEEKEDEEEEKYEPENDDEKKHVPEEESTDDEKKEVDEGTLDHEDDKNGDESIPEEGEKGFFSGGSIFDTPFFNLEQVKKYFSKLDRALGHVFRQTVDEALLLNGTYANTTEEEVDIGGKKYIVTKSVLKGADNNSMMYVEALSTKPKMDNSEVVQDIDIKNVTSK